MARTKQTARSSKKPSIVNHRTMVNRISKKATTKEKELIKSANKAIKRKRDENAEELRKEFLEACETDVVDLTNEKEEEKILFESPKITISREEPNDFLVVLHSNTCSLTVKRKPKKKKKKIQK